MTATKKQAGSKDVEILAEVDGGPSFKRAVLFVSRETIRSVMVKELKVMGIGEVVAKESLEECLDDLKFHLDSLLIVDWEHGEEKVIRILHAAQGEYRVDTRPILFTALEPSDQIVAVAHEFNVARVHTGSISKADIIKHVGEIAKNTIMSNASRQIFRQVTELRKVDDTTEVVELLKGLCVQEPNNLRAAVEYGFALFDDKQYDDAEAWLKPIAEQNPNELRVKHILARCAMKSGDFEKAQAILEEASVISPSNVERLVDLGKILLNQDAFQDAMAQFKAALEIDESDRDARVGQAQTQMLMGDINEAVAMLGQMENASELASVFNGAAVMAIRKRRFTQGMELYRAAVSFLKESPEVCARVFFNMGVALSKWNKTKMAIGAFERAAQLDPKWDKAQHNVKVLKAKEKRNQALGISPAEEAAKSSKSADSLTEAEQEQLDKFEREAAADFSIDVPDEEIMRGRED